LSIGSTALLLRHRLSLENRRELYLDQQALTGQIELAWSDFWSAQDNSWMTNCIPNGTVPLATKDRPSCLSSVGSGPLTKMALKTKVVKVFKMKTVCSASA
jgi:hypothetical protein